MNTITKAQYLEALLAQIDLLNKEGTYPDDLKILVEAYEDAKELDFKEVEIIQNGSRITLQPILENDND
ncbi:TPA: hypothetical protein L3N11_000968 [Vibrio parahaemolyticus]|nr:hypothetical protein [Vibrio parahaemolyticus]